MTDPIWDMNACATEIGRLIGNLQSLELQLRMLVHCCETGRGVFPLGALTQGAVVPSNAITNYDSLNQVMTKYNGHVERGHRVDARNIVALRDALAHGRIFLVKDGLPLEARLVKFGKERKDGSVPVELVIDITQEWCLAQRELLLRSMETVADAYEKASGYKVTRPKKTRPPIRP